MVPGRETGKTPKSFPGFPARHHSPAAFCFGAHRGRAEEKFLGRRTPLYDLHVEQGARMVDFGGWDMPVNYG
jgi:hypothetical protein